MRKIIIPVLFLCFLFLTTAAPAMELTPASIMVELRQIGPGAVIDELWNSSEDHPNEWDGIIERIGTGEKDWLEVAKLLKPASDAGSAEDLNGALAAALLKNPIDVLTMVQKGPFDISDVCSCPYVVETPDEEAVADKYLKEAERALIAMKTPIDNPRLNTVRSNCLAMIQGIIRDDNKRSREERPSPLIPGTSY